jgi:hypothetical protein
MDRLPVAMARSLGDIVPTTHRRPSSASVGLSRRISRRPGGPNRDRRARRLCGARGHDAPDRGAARAVSGKQRAFERLSYYPVARFLLQTKRRFWQTAGLSGSARTDRATETDAASICRRRAESWRVDGRRNWRDAPTAWRRRQAWHSVSISSPTFPADRSEFEKGVAYRWSSDPWALGAFAQFRPGQMTGLHCRRSRRPKTQASTSRGAHLAVDRMDGRRDRVWRTGRARSAGGRARAWPETADEFR